MARVWDREGPEWWKGPVQWVSVWDDEKVLQTNSDACTTL